jgi:hypothetical protein
MDCVYAFTSRGAPAALRAPTDTHQRSQLQVQALTMLSVYVIVYSATARRKGPQPFLAPPLLPHVTSPSSPAAALGRTVAVPWQPYLASQNSSATHTVQLIPCRATLAATGLLPSTLQCGSLGALKQRQHSLRVTICSTVHHPARGIQWLTRTPKPKPQNWRTR